MLTSMEVFQKEYLQGKALNGAVRVPKILSLPPPSNQLNCLVKVGPHLICIFLFANQSSESKGSVSL